MLKKEDLKPFFKEVYSQSNRMLETLLVGYFIFGVVLSFFYDTYLVGFGVGALCLLLYFSSKFLFKESRVNQYIGSLVVGIFMAQFIYQMHGLFEMHFTAFIAIIALITYQNKFVFIPQLLFVVIHHSVFAYIQYLGVVNENESYQQVYFTQLEYMDFQTFLFHAGLYAVGVVLAAIYAHNLEKMTIKSAENILKLRENEEASFSNIEFANSIAEGNFEVEYEASENDKMRDALLNMRTNIKKSYQREYEEKFINVGIAKVNEIIRNESENVEKMSDSIISYLVKYLNANQGGIFILSEEGNQAHMELKGCYAYDRKKFMEKKIAPGQGLIGQCFLEKETVHLKEVPQNYITITSGLGESTPNNLLIVPIKNDQTIEGAIEIASFKEFKEYEMDFLNKISEDLVATITSSKINASTKALYEQSKTQTEEMKAQEEEIRQNMEELSATQEEMERKSREFENRLTAINESGIGSIEFDKYGIIVDVNKSFCELMGYSKEELLGQHHKLFVKGSFARTEEYRKFWDDLANGKGKQGKFIRYDRQGNEVVLFGAYSILKNRNGEVTGVLKMANSIT